MRRLVLRPFRTAETYRNLALTGEGVLHVTDDVELLARAAVGTVEPLPRLLPAEGVRGWILADACRWYAFRVAAIDAAAERTTITADVVAQGTLREFFGFNRAKHAVVEAAILATRTSILPAEEVLDQISRLRVLVDKTGGEAEHRAFAFLEQTIAAAYAGRQSG